MAFSQPVERDKVSSSKVGDVEAHHAVASGRLPTFWHEVSTRPSPSSDDTLSLEDWARLHVQAEIPEAYCRVSGLRE